MTLPVYYQRYRAVDTPDTPTWGGIQWKGTNVCIDIYCVCGARSHYDGDFLYFFTCATCGRKYAVGTTVRFVELEADEVDEVLHQHGHNPFMTDEEPW